jgi:wyosine [tRNA(Phe)-imidazoG37] synthetase (radical SAM superfamily)
VLLALKESVTYGPVNSRRLGRSLGINLFPGSRKICTFDCAYCQYGWGEPVPGKASLPETFPLAREVLGGLGAALAALPEPPAFITFSGNGEPTLHPRFAEIAGEVIEMRDRVAPAAKTAILSNSSTVGRAPVRAALASLDVRIMKLDAGDEETFRRFNRPAPGQTLQEVLDGLAKLGGVTLQSLFAAGPGGNLAPDHVSRWVEAATSLKPLTVQLYTLDREAPSKRLARASASELEGIRSLLETRGVAAQVFGPRPLEGRGERGGSGRALRSALALWLGAAAAR